MGKEKIILLSGFLVFIILISGCTQEQPDQKPQPKTETIKVPELTDSVEENIVTWNYTEERTDDFRTWEERKNDPDQQDTNRNFDEGPTIPNITGTPEAENIMKIDNSTKTGRSASTEEQKSASPVIKNLGVVFAPYDPSTKKAGDFSFTVNPSYGKILGEFGQEVPSSSGTKALPHYTYYIPKNTPVTAVADGEIIGVWYQEETKDYEIYTKPVYDSYWSVGYDHVISPNVEENGTIKAGEVIAYAGDPSVVPLEISLETEKEKVGTSRGTFYPLLPYFDPSLKQENEQKVWKLLSDWETYKGNKNIYDEASMTSCPACLEASLPDNYVN